jgi:hypothetical protein
VGSDGCHGRADAAGAVNCKVAGPERRAYLKSVTSLSWALERPGGSFVIQTR